MQRSRHAQRRHRNQPKSATGPRLNENRKVRTATQKSRDPWQEQDASPTSVAVPARHRPHAQSGSRIVSRRPRKDRDRPTQTDVLAAERIVVASQLTNALLE